MTLILAVKSHIWRSILVYSFRIVWVFFFQFLCSVHNSPEKSENTALFLRLGLQSATVHKSVTKTELFENALQTGGI